MTVSSALNRKEYTGDDATVAFATSPVVFFDASDLEVYVVVTATGVATLQTITTHYTVSGGAGATGTVTMVTAPTSAQTLVIVRTVPVTQATDFVQNDPSDAEVQEDALDKLTMIAQQLSNRLDRAIVIPDSDIVGTTTELAVAGTRASKYLFFDATGNVGVATGTTEANPVSAFGATLIDDANAATARATLGFTDATAKGDIPTATAAGQYGRKAVGSDGDILVPSSTATDGLAWVGAGMAMWNGSLAVSVAANALTVALKTDAGADPSASDPVFVSFRDATLTTGTYTVLKVVAATSFVISSGSTLGTVSALPHRIYVVGVNDAGTFRLGCYNPFDDTNDVLKGIDDNRVYSSTAEGGAGGADSALTLYTGSAVTSKPVRILGYFESTQTTAGTWASEDTVVQVAGPGMRKTGDIVQRAYKFDGAVASGTTAMPFDDTIPQNTEGNEFMTLAATPTSTINLLKVKVEGMVGGSAANVGIITGALFQDTTADALAAVFAREIDASPHISAKLIILHLMRAATVSATTFKFRAGASSTNGHTFNGSAAARLMGGVSNSFMEVEEIFV